MSERFDATPFNPQTGADNPHCFRYLMARGFLSPEDVVIDAACGTGYGSWLMSQNCKTVYAYDRIDTFNDYWKRDNIVFSVQDLEKFYDFPKCDVFVSFETIEHLINPEEFFAAAINCTRRTIIMSSPDKLTAHEQEFHKRDVLFSDIRHMLAEHPGWQEWHSVIQGYSWIAIFKKEDETILWKK